MAKRHPPSPQGEGKKELPCKREGKKKPFKLKSRGVKAMNSIRNVKLTSNAQKLRKSMTEEERKLWYTFLKQLPLTVHRQKIIKNYIVDFYCYKAKLVIELDGSQHYDPQKEIYDRKRTADLNKHGIQVLRFTNLDIRRNFYNVCQTIHDAVNLRLS